MHLFTPAELGLTKITYTVNETIALMESSRTSLYKNVKAGKIRLTKNGRKSIFLATEIADFLSNLPNAEVE
jgi:hypothetical protein